MKYMRSLVAGACLALAGMASAQADDSFYNPAGDDGSCAAARHYEYQINGDFYLWEVPAMANNETQYNVPSYYYNSWGQFHSNGLWYLSFTCIDGTIYGGSGSHAWDPA